jgi:hypothetical protein
MNYWKLDFIEWFIDKNWNNDLLNDLLLNREREIVRKLIELNN